MSNHHHHNSHLAAVIVVSMATLLLNDLLWAQEAQRKKASNATKYSTTSIDTSLLSLPSQFRGHDAEQIFKRLRTRLRSNIIKDEFETTEEHKRRVSRETAEPLIGSLSVNSILGFQADRCYSSYDADTRTFSAMVELSQVFENGDVSNFKRSVVWKVDDIDRGSYVGTNAFGATVDVDRTEWKYVEVVLQNYEEFPIDRIQESRTFGPVDRISFPLELSIEPNEARKLKQSLAALFVCRLAEPYVTENQLYNPATFDSPLQTTTNWYYVHANLLEVWFYDVSKGRILVKIRPSPQTQNETDR